VHAQSLLAAIIITHRLAVAETRKLTFRSGRLSFSDGLSAQ